MGAKQMNLAIAFALLGASLVLASPLDALSWVLAVLILLDEIA